jgi:hypothetical protein
VQDEKAEQTQHEKNWQLDLELWLWEFLDLLAA